MKFNYIVSAIFGFMLIHLWIVYSELDRRLMINTQTDRLVFQAQNEAFAVHVNQINQLTNIIGEIVEMKS